MKKGPSYIMESIIYYDSAILIIKYNLQTSAVFSNLYLPVLNMKLKCGSCFHAKCLIQSSRITLQLWYYFQWVILIHTQNYVYTYYTHKIVIFNVEMILKTSRKNVEFCQKKVTDWYILHVQKVQFTSKIPQ